MTPSPPPPPPAAAQGARQRSIRPLLIVLAVSLAPVIAAVVMYLNPQWWPNDGKGYGTLISPQREVPAPRDLPLATLDGQPFDLASLRGRWVLAVADDGDCGDDCARKLFITRNVHASMGKHVDRVTRVWFVTDGHPVPQRVLDAYVGTVIVRADAAQAARFLLGPDHATDHAGDTLRELARPIWVIDPLGHLMLQFPDQAEPEKVRDDVRKLLNNSRIG